MAELILAILLVFFVHEGGHWMAARLFGKRLKFRFAWGRFCVPRFVCGPCPTCQKVSRESLLWRVSWRSSWWPGCSWSHGLMGLGVGSRG